MSRAKRKLTEAAVRDLPQPGAGEHVEWDRDVRGFGVRCRKDSKRLFVKFVSPVTGQQRKVNLGS
jgi:hypothetical protein